MRRKSLKKENNPYYQKNDYFNKNLKKIMNERERCLGVRRSSMFSRKKSEQLMQQNFTKNKIRIRSSGEKEYQKYKMGQCTARDEYFEKKKAPKVCENEDLPLI